MGEVAQRNVWPTEKNQNLSDNEAKEKKRTRKTYKRNSCDAETAASEEEGRNGKENPAPGERN